MPVPFDDFIQYGTHDRFNRTVTNRRAMLFGSELDTLLGELV